MITIPIIGSTILEVIKNIKKEVDRPIKVPKKDCHAEKTVIVYKMIGKYCHSSTRLKLVQLYESNKLCLIKLYGDYVFFEGIGQVINHNISERDYLYQMFRGS